MSKKALYVASVEDHLLAFHVPYLRMLKDKGFEVHTATSGENKIPFVDRHFSIPFTRQPLTLQNLRAYRELKAVLDGGGYTFVHCHTPAASFITRFAARKARKAGTKVIYTAHGFHFYDGGPKLRCFVFRTMEKFASRFTDVILTINDEDYRALSRYHFKNRQSFLTKGVGFDASRFTPPAPGEKERLRAEFGIPEGSFVLIYPAELCFRKNQAELFRAVQMLKSRIPGLLLLLPGEGADGDELKTLAAQLGIAEKVRFLGQRGDVDRLLKASDLDVTSSRQEGLSTHVLEALATGVPVVATRIRGHLDLVSDEKNGFCYKLGNPAELAEKIACMSERARKPEEWNAMRRCCVASVDSYRLENTLKRMEEIYDAVL